jgi:hypothetical protein
VKYSTDTCKRGKNKWLKRNLASKDKQDTVLLNALAETLYNSVWIERSENNNYVWTER